MPAWEGTVAEAVARARGSFRVGTGDAVPVALLAVVTLALFLTAPRAGDFWWSDVPRHALNGVFVRDFIAAMPLSDPVGYAGQYYLRYPALTILFYPPLYYVLSAPFFALFGVSHATALVPVLLGYFAFGCGSYAVLRRWFARAPALAGALLLMGAPIAALWGRQVMLELPCLAFLTWSVWLLLRYADRGRPVELYGTAALFLAALYTKQTVAFMALPMAVLILSARPRALRDRHLWIASALLGVGLVPLALLSWKFGAANAQSVAGIDDALVPRASIAGWVWYLRGLPEQLGWPVLALAAGGLIGALVRPRWRLPRRDAVFLAVWFVSGYLLFSAIDLKDLRFTMPILFPVAVLATLLLDRLARGDARRGAAVVAVGIAGVALTLLMYPVPRIAGYRAAVDLVADRAPVGSAVLFSGYRDGSFIFGLRAREDRRDLRVLRADKLLLKISVRRELGVEQKGYSEAEIADLLNRYGVRYVVAQTDFWTDLGEMQRLQDVLRSPRFEVVARVPVTGNVPHEDRELVIYRNLGPVAPPGGAIELELPIIGRSITGTIE